MKIFEVETDLPQVKKFYAGKTEACKVARECAAICGELVFVNACTLLPGKAGVVALANSLNDLAAVEAVYTAKPRKRSAQTHGAAAGCHGTDDDIEGLM